MKDTPKLYVVFFKGSSRNLLELLDYTSKSISNQIESNIMIFNIFY